MHMKFNRLKEWLVEVIAPEGHRASAHRIDVLYGLHLRKEADARVMRDLLTDDWSLIYPESELVCFYA
jgi:hypothetical protein